jgi:pimeloyl-ACP methyl ester carboxylesterase
MTARVLPHDDVGRGPAVVLLHAGVADRTMWAELSAALAGAGYRAIAPELPGLGEALIEPGPQAPWEDVLATMAALGVDDAALVGCSFGGAVALRVAAVAPSAVSRLALVSAPAPGVEPSPATEAAWAAEEAALARGDVEAAVEAVVDGWLLPDAPAGLRERVAAMQRRTFALQVEVAGVTEAPDPLDRDPTALARVLMPALVAVGARDHAEFVSGAHALAQALPGAGPAVVLPDAGHLAPLEQPEAFAALLLDFLGAPAT